MLVLRLVFMHASYQKRPGPSSTKRGLPRRLTLSPCLSPAKARTTGQSRPLRQLRCHLFPRTPGWWQIHPRYGSLLRSTQKGFPQHPHQCLRLGTAFGFTSDLKIKHSWQATDQLIHCSSLHAAGSYNCKADRCQKRLYSHMSESPGPEIL